MSDDKITLEELIELFGGSIPMEAVQMLFNAPPERTIGDVRADITALAKRASEPPDRITAVAVALIGVMYTDAAPLEPREAMRLFRAMGTSEKGFYQRGARAALAAAEKWDREALTHGEKAAAG